MAFSYNASITNYPKKGLAHLRMFLIKRIRASVSKLTNSIWLTETLFPTSETMTAAIVMIVMTAMKTATTAMKMATVAMKMTGSTTATMMTLTIMILVISTAMTVMNHMAMKKHMQTQTWKLMKFRLQRMTGQLKYFCASPKVMVSFTYSSSGSYCV